MGSVCSCGSPATSIDYSAGFGGEGGIRTPDTVTRMPHFECGAFNRSATSPEAKKGLKKPKFDRGYLTKGAGTDKSAR
jgi:hypothetical protein